MILRREEPGDYFAVENLTREAFWNVYRPGCMEHYVLHTLREDSAFVKELDYLIEDQGKIVAHIAYALGDLKTGHGSEKILLFGPVSVLPAEQGKGYGSALIRFTLEKAKMLGYPAVCITGNPDYYHRFGFESASQYGISYEGVGTDDEAPFFMVKFLKKDSIGEIRGVYSDPACYFPDTAQVERFDLAFPQKKKEKLPGQLE